MTVLGKHTVAETRVLVKDIDYQFKQVEDAFQRLNPAWKDANPDRYALLFKNWQKAKLDWADARTKVSLDLELTMAAAGMLASEDIVPAEEAYNRALRQTAQAGRNGEDSLYMTSRYITEINKEPIDYSGRPNQLGTWDFDFAAYNKSDGLVKKVEQTISENKGTILLVGLGVAFVGFLYIRPLLPRWSRS